MALIIYYLVFMILGDLIAVFIGLFVERMFGSEISLLTFLALYFLLLWVAWVLAVRVSAPKIGEPAAARSH